MIAEAYDADTEYEYLTFGHREKKNLSKVLSSTDC